MEQAITLDYLIKRGNEIINSLKRYSLSDNSIIVVSQFAHYSYNEEEYMQWEEISKRYLAINYPNDRVCNDFEEAIMLSKYDKKECVKKMVAVLVACRSLPQQIEKVTCAKSANIGTQVNVTNNNTLSQYQTIEIFIEALDLSYKQVKELKEIVSKEGDDLEKAKPKILEKIISWGGDVAAGVVTNLLTNPAIWSGL